MIIDNFDKLESSDDLIVSSMINNIIMARRIVLNDLSSK